VRHLISGLHHVTATVGEAQEDLDFTAGVLGLRQVKRTVNFDNRFVYHFYYGDERGTPGTIWTTFPYGGWGVPPGREGAGQIASTAFSVPAGSLASWQARLEQHGIAHVAAPARFRDKAIAFRHPSGLRFELVESGDDSREAWAKVVGPGTALRGLHSVTLCVRTPAATLELLTGVLGFTVVEETDGRIRVAVNGNRPGHLMDIAHDPDAPPARNGVGTVHHVARAIGTEEEQLGLRAELVGLGVQVTEVRDRQYFKSIYFREPGGVLFEVATTAPGFLVDEEVRHLGRDLKLPPWEEPHRAEIERRLPPIRLLTPGF
jgi:glyoxalase family protein